MSRYADIAEQLSGIGYEVGRYDCWGTVAQFYDRAFDIRLPNFARPAFYWEHGLDLITDGYLNAGFDIVEVHHSRLAIGDVLVMAVADRRPNHCAVYIGNGRILHHLFGGLSLVEPLNMAWRRRILWVGRHETAYQIPIEEAKHRDHSKDLSDILASAQQRAVRFRAERLNDR